MKGLQAQLQADHLPVEDARVFGEKGRALRGIDPAAGAGDHRAAQIHRVVLHGMHGGRQRTAHLADAVPPIIVISLHDELSARQFTDGVQIRHRVLELHGPGDIAGNDVVVVRIFFV